MEEGGIMKGRAKCRRLHEAVTFCLGLALACGVGIYLGHTAGEEAYHKEMSRIHCVQPEETLWDIAADITGDDEDIRQVIYRIQKENNIAGNEDIRPGQRLVINF